MMSSEMKLFEYQNFFSRYSHIKSHLICGKETEGEPFVTIIIPTYKRPVLLKDAIDSAINQKGFDDYEIVIVDNDPDRSLKTETQLLVEQYQHPKIRYYKHDENIGMFANWNRGVELAKGRWITLLHDDDYYFSTYLKEIAGVLESRPKIQGLKSRQFSWIDNGDEKIAAIENMFNNSAKPFLRKVKIYDNFFENAIGPTGIFYLKENIVKLGGFNVDFYPSADYLFASRYLIDYNTYIYEKTLGVYRWLNNDSLNFKTKESMILQDYLHREEYRHEIGLKNNFWHGLNRYLIKKRTKKFLIDFGYTPSPQLLKIASSKQSFEPLLNVVYRIFRIDLTFRDKSFVKRLMAKF